MAGSALIWDLIARDKASGTFNRVAASAERAAVATGKVTESMALTSARLESVGRKMQTVGSKMTRTITLPIAAVSALSIKAAVDFNTAMTKIQTQAGGSAKDVKTLSQQVLNLSQTAQHGPTELADALYHLKSVGMGNAQAMKALKASTDLANVSGANLEDTTNALAGAWKSGIRGAQNFSHAAAELNAIVGSGNIRMSDMVAALGTGILPTARTFGLTIKDVGAALALMTDEGVPADSAMTRLRMSFSLLGAPSQAAETQLNTIGLTGLKLANDMRKPNGLLVAMEDLRRHLDKSKLSLSQQAQLLSRAFGGGRSSSAILAMVDGVGKLAGKYQQADANISKFHKDVLTQASTPGAQFATLSANLQRAAVLLGNAILPSTTGLLKNTTGIVQWFTKLPSPVKTFGGYLAKAALIAGPLVWVGGKIFRGFAWLLTIGTSVTRFVLGLRAVDTTLGAMQTKAYLTGLRFRRAFSTLGSLVRSPLSAMRTFGTSLTTMSAGTLTLTSGAIGLTGAVAALGGMWEEHNQRAQAAAAIEQQLYGVLQQTKGAITGVTVQTVTQNLALSHVYENARKYGISIDLVTQAALGNKPAMKALADQTRGNFGAFTSVTSAVLGQAAGLSDASKAYKDATAQSKHHTDQAKLDAASTNGLSAAERLQSSAMADVTQKIKDATSSLLTYASAQLTAMGDSDSFKLGLLQMAQTLKTNGTSLSDTTQKGIANRQMIEGLASSLLTWAKDTKMGSAALIAHVRALQSQARQLGLNTGAVDKMLGKLGLLPAAIRAANGKLHIDTSGAADNVRTILGLLGQLKGSERTVGLNNVQHALRIPGNASGGGVPEGLSWVGEGGAGARPELIARRGSDVQVISHPKSMAIARSAGIKIPGFAKGTTSIEQLASRYRDWNPHIMAAIAMAESSGRANAHNYNLSTGDDSYGLWQINMLGSMGPARRREFGIRSNSALYNPSVNVRAAHDIWRSQNYGAWSTYNSGAYLQYMGDHGNYTGGGGPGAAVWNGPGLPPGVTKYGHGSHAYWQFNGHRYSTRNSAINAYNSAAQSQRQSARQKIQQARQGLRSGLFSWTGAMGSPKSERQAFRQLLPDLRALGFSDHAIAHLEAQNKRLDTVIARRMAMQKKLDAARAKYWADRHARRQERSTVAGAIGGMFDITTAGTNPITGRVTAGSMLAQAKQALTRIHKWAHGIERLRQMGLSNSYLRRLAEAGPSTWPQVQALLQSPALFHQIQRVQRQIDRAAGRFSGWESRQEWNPRIHHDWRHLRHDERRMREVSHHEAEIIRAMGDEMVRAINGMRVEIEPGQNGKVWLYHWVKDGEKQARHRGHRTKASS